MAVPSYLTIIIQNCQKSIQPQFSSKGFEKPYSADYEG
jgi:hypothetical protein